MEAIMRNKELTWRNISLVPYEDRFFEFVYKCYQNYEKRFLFTNDFVIISRNEFWDYLNRKVNRDIKDLMIIIDNNLALPIGFIYAYSFDRQNNFIYFSIFIEEKYNNNINLATSGIIFFNYLFKFYPIRKIYCSFFDYNVVNKKILNNAGFNFEGKLKEHHYYNRKYHDLYIYSLFREDFNDLKQKIMG